LSVSKIQNNNDFLIETDSYEASSVPPERRRLPRAAYEVAATLATDGLDGEAFVLYTRDVNSGGSGFVSPGSLGNTQAATLKIPTPDGTVRSLRCHVVRAREIAEGWVEGYVEFDEPTPLFSTKRIKSSQPARTWPIFADA
jgi:hypothetical protein